VVGRGREPQKPGVSLGGSAFPHNSASLPQVSGSRSVGLEGSSAQCRVLALPRTV
jgi:hypothetical protein